MARRIVLLLTFMTLLFIPSLAGPLGGSADVVAQSSGTCEPWQMPDGAGGCVDRCVAPQIWKDGECQDPPQCSEDLIDINGNGRDDGGDDCQPLDVVSAPGFAFGTNCVPVTDTTSGAIGCLWGWSGQTVPLPVFGAMGCLAVRRSPYPYWMVGVGRASDVELKLAVEGILDELEDTGPSEVGYYIVHDAAAWEVRGQQTADLPSNAAYRTADGQSIDTRRMALVGNRFWYPSINEVQVTLYATLNAEGNRWAINTDGTSDILPDMGLGALNPGSEDTILDSFERFPFASHPAVSGGPNGPVVTNGPDEFGDSVLPAFQLQAQVSWNFSYRITYQPYAVINNVYQRSGGRVDTGPQPLARGSGRRAWDVQQPYSAEVADAYCNASDGYIPLAVIEGQAVLVP